MLTAQLHGKNQYNGMTYARMEKFINALPNSEELLKPFTFLKATGEYANVRRWFEAQFPYYRSNPLFYYNSNVIPLNATDFMTEEEYIDYADEAS